jgi:hypothetical protein
MMEYNPDLAQEIWQRAKAPPYPHCTSVLLQEIRDDFVAGNLETESATICPPMDEQILTHIIHLIELNANFPCSSLHRVSHKYMEQVPIHILSIATALRPNAICRVRRPSPFSRLSIHFGFIWKS